uniref:LIM domain 7 n=1 Tax=Myotis myotis TaxID=51298 RepID=A0A7J7Z5K0_MYOMY|nr:LIM domain 7 [Myotis myotis]
MRQAEEQKRQAEEQKRRTEEQMHQAERERETSVRIYQYRRPVDSYDIPKGEEESSGLLPSDRNKSRSTTELDDFPTNKNGSHKYLDRVGNGSSTQRSAKKEPGPSGAELERQSPWLSQSTGVYASSSVQDFSRPPPQLVSTSNRAYMRNPSSSVHPPAAGPVKTSPAPSPTPRSHFPSTSPSQPRNRSVSGKRVCSYCNNILGKGAAMIIESLGLCYHLYCFKCVACECDLGGSSSGAEVRIRNSQLYCNNCYLRFKSGRPTAM